MAHSFHSFIHNHVQGGGGERQRRVCGVNAGTKAFPFGAKMQLKTCPASAANPTPLLNFIDHEVFNLVISDLPLGVQSNTLRVLNTPAPKPVLCI